MIITYQTELDVRFLTNPNRGRRWMLLKPFVFYVGTQRFEIPPGFYTDFASIPRIVWPVVGPYEIGKGPIPHDFGYYTGLECKSYWDDVLFDCMKCENIDKWKRKPVLKSVKWFGTPTWKDYRKQGSTEDQLNKLLIRGHGVNG